MSMSPQSAAQPTPVTPTQPNMALGAELDPKAIAAPTPAQGQTQAGSVDSDQAQSHKPDPTKKAWIEIQLVGDDGKPVPGEAYQVTLPDGTVSAGSLNTQGLARVDGFDPGTCKITFPNLDTEAWSA